MVEVCPVGRVFCGPLEDIQTQAGTGEGVVLPTWWGSRLMKEG